jgi:hypothetical protein
MLLLARDLLMFQQGQLHPGTVRDPASVFTRKKYQLTILHSPFWQA